MSEETTLPEIINNLRELGMTKSEAQKALLEAFERAEDGESVYIWNERVDDDSTGSLYRFIFKCEIKNNKYHWFIMKE